MGEIDPQKKKKKQSVDMRRVRRIVDFYMGRGGEQTKPGTEKERAALRIENQSGMGIPLTGGYPGSALATADSATVFGREFMNEKRKRQKGEEKEQPAERKPTPSEYAAMRIQSQSYEGLPAGREQYGPYPGSVIAKADSLTALRKLGGDKGKKAGGEKPKSFIELTEMYGDKLNKIDNRIKAYSGVPAGETIEGALPELEGSTDPVLQNYLKARSAYQDSMRHIHKADSLGFSPQDGALLRKSLESAQRYYDTLAAGDKDAAAAWLREAFDGMTIEELKRRLDAIGK